MTSAPPQVTTFESYLKAATIGILGAKLPLDGGVLQKLWLKEENTAKFNINCGKKKGTSLTLQVLEDPTPPFDCKPNLFQIIEKETIKMINDDSTNVNVFVVDDIPRLRELFVDFDKYYGKLLEVKKNKKKKKKAEEAEKEDGKDKEDPKPPTKLYIVLVNGLYINFSIEEPMVISNLHEASTPGELLFTENRLSSWIIGGEKARKADIAFKFKAPSPPESCNTVVPLDLFDNEETLKEVIDTYTKLHSEQQSISIESVLSRDIEQAKAEEEAQRQQAVAEEEKEEEMVVTAHEVSGKVDYMKLIEVFGSKAIDPALLSRVEALIKKRSGMDLHPFLSRGIFFSHRDLNMICDLLEKEKTVYLYTGRGPSSDAMHLGHLIPFMFTQYLQAALDLPLVIQLTDDEKFIFQKSHQDAMPLSHFQDLAIRNAKDILACGFKKDKTFIFRNTTYLGQMYPNIVQIWKASTQNQIINCFGFVDKTENVGKMAFPAIQAAPSFPSSFPIVLNTCNDSEMEKAACLIPCAIDQDPYFRLTRDIGNKLVVSDHPLQGKPALIHSKFFPALQGSKGKMSSSNTSSAVFLTDSLEEVTMKINTHAYSGGQETAKLQRELGADLEEDVAYQWLTFFCHDDALLQRIKEDYSTGTGEYWSTGVVKKKLIEVIWEILVKHQALRKGISDEEVWEWMNERSIV